jgi:hypothetical protein
MAEVHNARRKCLPEVHRSCRTTNTFSGLPRGVRIRIVAALALHKQFSESFAAKPSAVHFHNHQAEGPFVW